MKKILFFCLFILLISDAFASHISGGEMTYIYLGPGTNPGSLKYQVTLKLYRDCNSTGAPLETSVVFTVFNTSTSAQFLNIQGIPGSATFNIRKTPSDPCIDDNIELGVCFDYKTYTTVIDNIPITPGGFTVAFQRCCRIDMENIFTTSNVGATYFTKLPGNFINGAETNTSPVFKTSDTVLICSGRLMNFDFSATDADGDSLTYRFYNAFTGGGSAGGGNVPDPAFPPPYTPCTYINGYSAMSPLGPLVTLNPLTGLISGTAPNVGVLGNKIFAVTVLVQEYRNGILIADHFKDLQIRIVDCQIPTANLDPVFTTCSGFSVTFSNNVPNNPLPTFYWDFGDPITGPNNTSTLQSPVHVYSDTGVFLAKLVLNQGLQCGDSTTMSVRIYPEFFPGFTSTPLCANTPVQFTDTTYFRYGNMVAWRWDFGDGSTLGDTSHLQNPIYSYTTPGNYLVELRVTNDKGCTDIYTKNITISDVPVIVSLTADSSYCGLDSLQLNAAGTGSFNWTPATNIIGANTATPLVYPAVPTWYKATLTNASGCFKTDSVLVTPKFDLTNSIAASTISICEEDTLQLTGSSNKTNNLSWQWSPAGGLETPATQNSRAWPSATTNYTLTTTWGAHCIATSSQNITVKPLAIPNAGPDAALCNGQASIQLNAFGGDTYKWTPIAGLNNPNISNPVASPVVTTTYIVEVGVTGCSKTRFDSLVLTVRTLPAISTTHDTIICISDTLQLNSTGTGNFTWSPNYMISNTTISDPLVSPDVPTTYYVRLTDGFGCYQDDSVFIDVVTSVPVFAGGDTTICQTDAIVLNPVSRGLYYQWTPSTYLDFNNIKNPVATPPATITYTVIASIGSCVGQDDIKITVVPYPIPNAGTDKSICFGFSTQLSASGGSSYVWSPATFLNDRFSANPTVTNPTANIQYIVNVRDTFGCPKPVKDTVWVYVAKPVIADAGPSDTTAVLGEPLFLHATGGDSYTWIPPLWLSDPSVQSPVALPQDDITYTVTATTAQGCVGTDRIRIKWYRMDPDLYVPTGFTPNGDLVNNVLRPILLGMRELHFFRVYNRNGQLVYSTTEKNAGWDGRFKGVGQDAGTYVWMAEGINYRGELRQKKGTTVLIR
ncbi:MAG: PKD domain-containing protein [Ferruginibacter sp.]